MKMENMGRPRGPHRQKVEMLDFPDLRNHKQAFAVVIFQ